MFIIISFFNYFLWRFLVILKNKTKGKYTDNALVKSEGIFFFNVAATLALWWNLKFNREPTQSNNITSALLRQNLPLVKAHTP